MTSVTKLVLSAGVVAALSWAPALAVQAPAGAATPASSATSNYGSFNSVSCPPAGNYIGKHRQFGGAFGPGYEYQAIVNNETNGKWGRDKQVAGLSSLPGGLFSAQLLAVSCSTAGNCGAGGWYTPKGNFQYPLVVDDKNGVWDSAQAIDMSHLKGGPIQTVPGLQTVSTGGPAAAILDLVWCGSAAHCVAVGHYPGPTASARWFSVTERNGTWGKAVNLRMGARTHIYITTMSCTSVSDCSGGGYYYLSPTNIWTGAFVISKTNGVWGKAEQIPGLNRFNHGGSADTNSVSCYAPGSCVAAGDASPQRQFSYPIIATETAGTWGNATEPRLP